MVPNPLNYAASRTELVSSEALTLLNPFTRLAADSPLFFNLAVPYFTYLAM